MTLFGFSDEAERDFFELLMTASGVGPKLAQAALAVLTPDDLRTAISSEDVATLTRVPGIGRKGAQRIVLELKDKVHVMNAAGPAVSTQPSQAGWRDQVAAGLQGLGWSAKDAEAACTSVAPMAEADPQVSIAILMRAALQALAK